MKKSTSSIRPKHSLSVPRRLNFQFLVILLIILLPFQLFSQEYSWRSVPIGGGGFVSGIITSKHESNLMYARTDVGGVYKWDETTKTWNPLLDWLGSKEGDASLLGVEALAIDPQATNKLYLLCGLGYAYPHKTAILKSSDYGKTFSVIDVTSKFKAHGNGYGRQNGERLAVDPNNGNILLCGTRANGLFKSTDAGETWNAVSSLAVSTTPNQNGISFVVFDPSTGTKGTATQTLFVGVSTLGNNLYVSKNGGTTFSHVTGAPTTLMPQRAVFASDGNLFITYANGAGPHPNSNVTSETMTSGQIWKYNPTTGIWTDVTPQGITSAFGGISIDPKNPQRIIASTINVWLNQYGNANGDRIYLSTNGGSSWRDLMTGGITMDPNGITWIEGHAIHWTGSIEFNPNNTNQAWVTSGNGVFLCEDVNATKTTWKFVVKGLEETVPLDIVSVPGGPVVSVIGDYDGFVHTDFSNYSPIHNPQMGTTTGLSYAGNGGTSLMVRVGKEMYYSTNDGTSWTKTPTIKGTKGNVEVSSDTKTILHCPEDSKTTFYTTDKGATWTLASGLEIPNALPVADPVNPLKFYVYPGDTIETFYRSVDGGKSFTKTLKLNEWGSKVLRCVPGREGDIWYAGNWDGLKRSTNSGTSFTKLSSVESCAAVGFGKAAPGKTFPTVYIYGKVNGVTGIFRSTDEGVTWTRINNDNHMYGGPGNGQFVVGDMNVYGRVFMSTAGRGLIVGEIGNLAGIENEFTTHNQFNKCIPNPFSETFLINTDGPVSYRLLDIMGNELEKGSGVGALKVGTSLVSGIYIVQIQTPTGHSIEKVIKK